MKFNFRKISAIVSSALMMGMTMGVAAASNYPSPFISGGVSNVAVVYGTGEGVSSLDVVQAGNIQTNLQSFLSGTTSTSTSTTGEVAELFTGGTKIYISDGLNKVKSVLTKTELPTVLADGSFSGNVDASYTQTIDMGTYPNITYEKQPTSSDDPNLGLKLSTSASGNAAFKFTVAFSKTVNFSHADSEGQDINLFGQKYTISSATSGTDLVLLQSAEKVSLSSDSPTADVTIAGKTYTIELISASDTSATVAITNEAGVTESKEVNEAASKKINGITVAVTNADETNLKLSATIVAGSEKVTFTDGTYVKVGESDTSILGTHVSFYGGNPGVGLSKMSVNITAEDSDKDSLKVGGVLTDPVFKTAKLELAGFNIEETSTSREDIKVQNNGDNRMEISLTDHTGNAKTIKYAKYGAGGDAANISLYVDDEHHNMSVRERENLHREDMVVLGNEDEAHLLKVSTVTRSTSGWSSDKLDLLDQFTGETKTVTFSSNTSSYSTGTVVIGGKTYTAYVEGAPGIDYALYNVSFDYPDSGTSTEIIVFPTIQTSKGAKVAFYEPLNLSVSNWGGNTTTGLSNLTGLVFPNGADAYQTVTLARSTNTSNMTITCASTAVNGVDNGESVSCNITNTGFGYNLLYDDENQVLSVYLRDHSNNNIIAPAIMIFEEKDDNNIYEGLIVITESGSSSDDGIGVSDVERTWTDDVVWDSTTMYTDSKKEQEIDLWGTLITTDKGDSDQAKATISYPDEQVYALLYIAEESASITAGGSTTAGTQLGDVLVKDSEVSSVSTKNLIIIGGSCINSAAAKALGVSEHTCSADFTTATGVGSGQFLIKGVADAYTEGKIALVVAGYDSADTVNAAKYLTSQTVDTSKEYKGTTSTSATEVVTETA